MRPGLYQVVTSFFVAGFVILPDGSLGACAPIVRKQFLRWSREAVWLGP